MAGNTPPSAFYNPDPVDVVEDAALAPTPIPVAPGLTPALASTGQEMRTGQPRARYGGRMNADGGLAWNAQNDQMMPGGTAIQESRTAWGDPLFGNTGQVLPHAHWANVLQGNKLERAKRRAEIRKRLDEWDPAKGIEEVSPAYQESLDKYVASQIEGVYKAAIDLNGGDEARAQEAFLNPMSAESRAMKSATDAAAVVARKANFVTNDAIATMKAMDDADAEYIPEVYEAADIALRALNNGGDVRKVADSMEQYQVVKEWNSFMKEKGLQTALKDAAFGKDVLVPGRRDALGNNLYDTLTVANPEQRDRILDLYAAQVPPKYHKMWGAQGVKDKLSAYLTMNEEAKRQIDEPWHGWSPSQQAAAQPKAWVGEVEQGTTGTPVYEQLSTGGAVGAGPYAMQLPGSETVSKPQVQRVPVGETVSGQQRNMGTRKLTDSEGRSLPIEPQYVEKLPNGELYIVGKLVGSGRNTTYTTSEYDQETGEYRNVDKTEDTSSNKTDIRIPLKGNESAMDGYLGGQLGSVTSKLGVQPRTQAPAFQTDAPQSSGTGDYEIKGKKYSIDDLKAMGYTEAQVAPYRKVSKVTERPETPRQETPQRASSTSVAAPKTAAKEVITVKAIPTVEPVMTKTAVVDTLRTQAPVRPAAVATAAQEPPKASAALDFFKGGRIVKSDMGGKKVYFITQPGGMQTPLSTYFEDEESAKLVLDAFNRGEIYPQHLSKFRSVKDQFEKVRRERGE